jgi:hypothetical protein
VVGGGALWHPSADLTQEDRLCIANC